MDASLTQGCYAHCLMLLAQPERRLLCVTNGRARESCFLKSELDWTKQMCCLDFCRVSACSFTGGFSALSHCVLTAGVSSMCLRACFSVWFTVLLFILRQRSQLVRRLSFRPWSIILFAWETINK